MHILIVGMGDTGGRLATQLLAQGHQVTGMRRSPFALDGVTACIQSAKHADLSACAPIDWVYVILAPSTHDAAGYQQTFIDTIAPLSQALADHPVQRVVFVSSTSVHGQDQGEWINEHTPPNAQRYNGAILWSAEQTWRATWGERLLVVRPSGVYGPQRDRLMRWLQSGKPVQMGQWSNRIHVDDLAGFLAHLTCIDAQLPLYLATDNAPVLLDELLAALAHQAGLPMVAQLPAPIHGKRIDNQALRHSGYVLRYPTWRQGYGCE